MSLATGEESTVIRDRVMQGRVVQQQRFRGNGGALCNAEMGAKDVQNFCTMGPDAQQLLKMAITELNFSARAYDRILKVSRTIADLEGADTIQPHHVSEAIQYRTLDRQLWA